MKPRSLRTQTRVAECPGLALDTAGATRLLPQACLPMKRPPAHQRHRYFNAAAVSLVTSVSETAQGPMMAVMADGWFRQLAIFKLEVFAMQAGDRVFTIFCQGV